MTPYKPRDVLLVPFPFTNLKTKKKRPALVLSAIASSRMPFLYIIAMITSQIAGEKILGDCLITRWQEAGLLDASKIRLAKVVTVEGEVIIKKLGQLHLDDQRTIAHALKTVFDDWL